MDTERGKGLDHRPLVRTYARRGAPVRTYTHEAPLRAHMRDVGA